MPQRIATFREFWPFYVSQHMTAGCRKLHFFGTSSAVVCLLAFLVTLKWYFIPIGLFIGYAFAWYGHFIVEKNRPATFQYPLWSFISDWIMWSKMLTGKMDAEVTKVAHPV